MFMKVLDYIRNGEQLPDGLSDLDQGEIEMELKYWGFIQEPEEPL